MELEIGSKVMLVDWLADEFNMHDVYEIEDITPLGGFYLKEDRGCEYSSFHLVKAPSDNIEVRIKLSLPKGTPLSSLKEIFE